MKLFFRAQDISRMTVGLIEGHSLVLAKTVDAAPEEQLQQLKLAWDEWGSAWSELEAVVVVLGPGSATALRASVTIANAIGFVRSVPVIGLVNPGQLTPDKLLAGSIDQIQSGSYGTFAPLSPVYDRPPV